MNAAEFAKLVGPHLLHVTPKSNVAGITAAGLLPAAELARLAGIEPKTIVLRENHRVLASPHGAAQLSDQRAFLAGKAHEADFLDGYTMESWAAQMDSRIFFWPTRKDEGIADNLAADEALYTIDSEGFFDAFRPHISLAPIVSGNAERRPARRGPWLYVPASAPIKTLRQNRHKRGLIVGRDNVIEVSVTCPIPADALARLSR